MPLDDGIRDRIELLVKRHGDMIYRLAYQHTGNTADAEDIYGEVCLALLTKNAPLFDDDHIRHWLVRVTLNKCRNLLNSSAKKQIVPLETADELYAPVRDSVLDEVMTLPSKYRIVVYLHYYEGYTIAEIAGFLRTKPATVGTWLSRARKRLKLILEQGELL